MTKWEYAELELTMGGALSSLQAEAYIYHLDGNHEEIPDKRGILFAKLGEEGWELVTSNARVEPGVLKNPIRISYLFKRQKAT
jgi:hypothetical protein